MRANVNVRALQLQSFEERRPALSVTRWLISTEICCFFVPGCGGDARRRAPHHRAGHSMVQCVERTVLYFNLEGGFWAVRGDDG
jgi:hypothetical protein